MLQGKSPFRVSELASHLNQVLRQEFPVVQLVGEVSQFTRASSGHWYLTLKDESAQIKAVMFRTRNIAVGFLPQLGDQVEVLAQVGIYEPRGDLQLTIETLKRAGQGSLFEQFLKLKARLATEGLFDVDRKRPLPQYVFRVGVITSSQAAALADIRRALARRVPHVQYTVHHTLVQGEGSVPAIVKALQVADAQGYDVLILARGGGSLEDLWSFNEEAVVRQVRACATPIVVGVGHESDFTLAELAADVRAATPTAAVELISRPTVDLQDDLDGLMQRLRWGLGRQLQVLAQRVDRAEMGLVTPEGHVQRLADRLGNAQALFRHRLLGQLERTDRRFEELTERLGGQVQVRVQKPEERLARLDAVLQALSPLRNLEKGYAFLETRGEGHPQVLNSVGQAQVGQGLTATLRDGQLQVLVQGKQSS